MTGSERAGPEAASADLFKGEHFFLCPVPQRPRMPFRRSKSVLEAIGATAVVIDPERVMTGLVAQLSHLPQILSTLLADQTSENTDLAGPGWKSVTRLAASPFHVWRDILETSGSLPDELRSFARVCVRCSTRWKPAICRSSKCFSNGRNRAVSGESHE